VFQHWTEAGMMRVLADRTPALAAGAFVHRFEVVAIAAVTSSAGM
jgi:hypothetical protein